MLKKIIYIFFYLLWFSNLYSQEVFFEKGQSGFNLSYFYNNAGKSIINTGKAIGHSFAGSYILNGNFVFHGRIINSNEEVSFDYPETISGSGYGIGIGFITRSKKNLFSILITIDYSSSKYNSKYESEFSVDGLSGNLSLFKNLKFTQDLRFIPEIFAGYGVADISFETESKRGNVFGYGVGINIGYFKEKFFGPSIGMAMSGSSGLVVYSLRGTISIGNLTSQP